MRRLIVVVAVLSVGAGACKKKKPQPPSPKPVARTTTPSRAVAGASGNVAILKAGYQAFNQGRLADSVRNMADDVAWINVGMGKRGRLRGKGAVRAFFEQTRKAFPDARVTPTRIFSSGDNVVVESIYTGTNRGPFMGKPPTGKKFGLGVAHWFLLRKGKVRRVFAYTDTVTILQQLGRMPPLQGWMPPVQEPPAGPAKVVQGPPNPANAASYRKALPLKPSDPALAQYFARDVEIRSGSAGKVVRGLAAFRKIAAPVEKGFPDGRRLARKVLTTGNWLIARWTFVGTHRGDMGRIKATGKRVRLRSLQIASIEGGKATRVVGYSDRMQFLAQLGLLRKLKMTGKRQKKD